MKEGKGGKERVSFGLANPSKKIKQVQKNKYSPAAVVGRAASTSSPFAIVAKEVHWEVAPAG